MFRDRPTLQNNYTTPDADLYETVKRRYDATYRDARWRYGDNISMDLQRNYYFSPGQRGDRNRIIPREFDNDPVAMHSADFRIPPGNDAAIERALGRFGEGGAGGTNNGAFYGNGAYHGIWPRELLDRILAALRDDRNRTVDLYFDRYNTDNSLMVMELQHYGRETYGTYALKLRFAAVQRDLAKTLDRFHW